MQEEVEIGEYVRTQKGKIFKYGKGRAYLGKNNKIVKHSKNVIDLIKEGDILKIKISEEWEIKEDTNRFIIVGQTHSIEEIKEGIENGIFNIKAILTKQQFESIEYKI